MTSDIVTRRSIARANDRPPPSADDVVIGKDLLELLSAGMYVDQLSIYREYVQNAADAIDQARSDGLLAADEPGRIDIALTPQGRSIRIRDNGTGLGRDDFVRTLLAVGGSRKRGTPFRGFRGVGRLAGLAYAQELIFRSRAAGESDVSQLRWDSRKLKTALRDSTFEGGIERLILHSVETGIVPGGDYPDRFFEVELKGVIRLRADRLMTPEAVEQFLAQHAPVPFSPDFRFGREIAAALRVAGVPLPVQIHLDGREAPLYRPHRNVFDLGNGREAAFTELELRQIPDMDGGPAALAWVLHHEYSGAIPQANLIKGLRTRVGDLQVGGSHVLEECFVEQRFNSWSVGEVHVLDRRIVPNGRRDDFEQNVHHNNLLNHLSPLIREISKRCRGNSIRRKWEREFDVQQRIADETLDILAQRSVGSDEWQKLARLIEQALAKMTKVAEMSLLAESAEQRLDLISKLRRRLAELMSGDSNCNSILGHLVEAERKTYERVFELIYECSANRVAAKALIDRMLTRLG